MLELVLQYHNCRNWVTDEFRSTGDILDAVVFHTWKNAEDTQDYLFGVRGVITEIIRLPTSELMVKYSGKNEKIK